jgi:hypothetical protein
MSVADKPPPVTGATAGGVMAREGETRAFFPSSTHPFFHWHDLSQCSVTTPIVKLAVLHSRPDLLPDRLRRLKLTALSELIHRNAPAAAKNEKAMHPTWPLVISRRLTARINRAIDMNAGIIG